MDFENQQLIETIFNDKQTPKLLKKELLSSPDVVQLIQDSGLDEAFALDLLGQMILRKRATVPELVGVLKHHFKAFGSPHQLCAYSLEKAVHMDLVDWDVVDERFVLRFDLDEATHQIIRNYQYLPPMIVPPLEVTSNRGSGYLTIQTDSLILKDNHHDGDIGLDSLNKFNAIPLSLNVEAAKTLKNQWRHLDRQKDGETFQEYQKRLKAFDRYQRDTAFTMALLVETGNRFHLTHKVDKRGRTYCQGYHCSYQSYDWQKAVIELADKETLQ